MDKHTHDSNPPLEGGSTISRSEISGRGPATEFLCYPTQLIRLRHLRFGHECIAGEVNLRHPTRADGEQLAPSILREGLLQALSVWPSYSESADGPYYVIAGGRRLAALHVLRETGLVTDDLPVSCVIVPGDSAAEALARSMVTEDTHVPPHPVDRFDAFHRLAEGGFDATEIATRFFVDKKIVRQALALGDLAGEVRDAWRAGEVDEPTAQCFTLAASKEHQVKVLAKLRKKGGTIDAATVRKQFTGSEAEANRLLKFVGRNEYVAAGGALTEDLFTTSVIVHNFAKLKNLAEAKLEGEAARLKAEGWAFTDASVSGQRPYHSYAPLPKGKPDETERKRLAAIEQAIDEIEADEKPYLRWSEQQVLEREQHEIETAASLRSMTPAQKSTLGCELSINSDGELVIEYGAQPKQDPDSTSPSRGGRQNAEHFSGGGNATKPAEQPITGAVCNALDQWQGAAAGETLARDEDLALATLLAELQVGEGPMGVYANDELVFVPKTDSLGKIITTLRKQKSQHLLSLLIKTLCERLSPITDEDFLAALDQVEFAKALKRRFDAKIYFTGCSKPHLLNILTETGTPFDESKSKHDLANLCIAKVAPLGWLPPELRTAAYKPPSSPAQRSAAAGEVPAKPGKGARAKSVSKAPKKPTTAAKRARAKAQRP
jgi:ParB family chromosome partitioning protein